MTTAVTVVDDSFLSRKMLIKALPSDWDVEITQASNGREALEACRAGKAHVMFLDLTMPDMDGYQVLEHLQKESLKTSVIVVSADIQPEAQQRVKQLGAIAFIEKSVKIDQIKDRT
jgi:two-component system, chemotaxis family, chemotaxis protein CheY